MSEKEQLKELIGKEKKVFLGLVHQSLYGPLKGIHGIIKDPKIDELDKFLKDPIKTQRKLITKTHRKTGMATQVMVLPLELAKEAETEPKEFETINELMNFMREEIGKAPDLEKDPWYFRLGKL